MRHSLLILLLAITGVVAGAHAGDQDPASTDELIALIEAADAYTLQKDTFETTEAYRARVRGPVGREFLITLPIEIGPPSMRRPVSYDADSKTLSVAFLGDGILTMARARERGNPEAEKLLQSSHAFTSGWTKFRLKSTSSAPETYDAQTAGGAVFKVNKIVSKDSSVALLNVPAAPTRDESRVVKVTVEPEVARQIAKRLKWRIRLEIVAAPWQSSWVVVDGLIKKPTFDDPVEIVVVGTTALARSTLAEVVDSATGIVYATFKADDQQAQLVSAASPQRDPLQSEAPSMPTASETTPSPPDPVMGMVPSLSQLSIRNVAWVKSTVTDGKGAAVLVIGCKINRELAVSVGTTFPIRKAMSIWPPLTLVRFSFDDERTLRNWRLYGRTEAGPMAALGGFVESLRIAKTLMVQFERDDQSGQEDLVFSLSDPGFREKVAAIRTSCQ